MRAKFSIRSLLLLTACISVLLTGYLYHPGAVEQRRFKRDTRRAWTINRKIRMFEESSPSQITNSISELLDLGVINKNDSLILNALQVRFTSIEKRSFDMPVRMEMLIENHRILCFLDGSVLWFRDNEDGYDSMDVVEFWKLRGSRPPRSY